MNNTTTIININTAILNDVTDEDVAVENYTADVGRACANNAQYEFVKYFLENHSKKELFEFLIKNCDEAFIKEFCMSDEGIQGYVEEYHGRGGVTMNLRR